jgi:hypothetical protein
MSRELWMERVVCFFCAGTGIDPDLCFGPCPICGGEGAREVWAWDEDEDEEQEETNAALA